MSPIEMESLVRDIAEQITVAADGIDIRLSRAKVAIALEATGASQWSDLYPVVLTASTPLHCGSASGAIIWHCSCVSRIGQLT
jgi:hypothetical protein